MPRLVTLLVDIEHQKRTMPTIMTPKDTQIAYEASLKLNQPVTIKWTWKGRHQATATVTDLDRESTLVCTLTDASAPFMPGDLVTIPRRQNPKWSVHNTVWSGRSADRPCEYEGCANLIGPEQPERKRFCSGACRIAEHRRLQGKQVDLKVLIEAMTVQVMRLDDLELSRAWRGLLRRLRKG